AGKTSALAQLRGEQLGAALGGKRSIQADRAGEQAAGEQTLLRRPRRVRAGAGTALQLGAQRALPLLEGRHASARKRRERTAPAAAPGKNPPPRPCGKP